MSNWIRVGHTVGTSCGPIYVKEGANPIGSMGRTVYLPTFMLIFYGKLVGNYTIPMDPMGIKQTQN